MKRKTINLLSKQKTKKITCLTAYTSSIAKIIDKHVDMILVGDSLGTVIYGMKNTQSVSMEMMMLHGRAVVKNSKRAFTIVDMPFNSYKNKKDAFRNAKKLLKFTKCQSIKIESNHNTVSIIKHLCDKGINVISHIGVTPQKYKDFKKIRSLGNTDLENKSILELAIKLERVGSKMIFLECIKKKLADKITDKIKIPTIGIGASDTCDGQVLVIDDILNIENFLKMPKFIKTYANLNKIINDAVKQFTIDVKKKKFPNLKNTY